MARGVKLGESSVRATLGRYMALPLDVPALWESMERCYMHSRSPPAKAAAAAVFVQERESLW